MIMRPPITIAKAKMQMTIGSHHAAARTTPGVAASLKIDVKAAALRTSARYRAGPFITTVRNREIDIAAAMIPPMNKDIRESNGNFTGASTFSDNLFMTESPN